MSHSRKHVIQKTLEQDPLPTPTQKVVRVVEARGDNIYLVEHPTGEKVLCVRPAKFKNVLWIKRGDFLIIEPEPEEKDKNYTNKVRAVIVHVLYPDQIKFIKEKQLWPSEFVVEEKKGRAAPQLPSNDDENSDDDDLRQNPNRRPIIEEEEDENEDSDEEED